MPVNSWVEIADKGASSIFGDIPVGGIYYNPAAVNAVSGDDLLCIN